MKGYTAMEKGKLVVMTDGALKFAINFALPFAPRKMILKMIYKMQHIK
jgi:hypothetical protein